MGLDDFVTSKEYGIGEVKSRKKVENVNITEHTLRRIIAYHPYFASEICHEADDSGIKAMVSMMDEIIQNGLKGEEIGEQKIEEVEREREELVDFHLRDNN